MAKQCGAINEQLEPIYNLEDDAMKSAYVALIKRLQRSQKQLAHTGTGSKRYGGEGKVQLDRGGRGGRVRPAVAQSAAESTHPEPEPEPVDAQDPTQLLTTWPGGVHRKWVEKSAAALSTDPANHTPCRFGAACTRPNCWYTHPPGHPLSSAGDASSVSGISPSKCFTILTWNVQSASTRGPDVDAADRSGVEACVHQILCDPRLRSPQSPDQPPDILSLQELQRCRRQIKQGDCYHCGRGACRYDHAGWAAAKLARNGYDGAMHEHGMKNTVGLFWRRDVFKLPPRRDGRVDDRGTVFFCDFDRPETVGGSKVGAKVTKKGAVLALLTHRATGHPLLVCAVHPSVPLSGDGQDAPQVPLAEMKQVSCATFSSIRSLSSLCTAVLNPLFWWYVCR